MKDEALRLALEALGHFEKAGLATLKTIDAITAIKQALEQEKALQALHNENKRLGLYKDAYGQQEPEPVAYVTDNYSRDGVNDEISAYLPVGTKLYTSPQRAEGKAHKREWQGLTDEEMHECWDSPLTPLGMKHARMIEAKLKEKNHDSR